MYDFLEKLLDRLSGHIPYQCTLCGGTLSPRSKYADECTGECVSFDDYPVRQTLHFDMTDKLGKDD